MVNYDYFLYTKEKTVAVANWIAKEGIKSSKKTFIRGNGYV